MRSITLIVGAVLSGLTLITQVAAVTDTNNFTNATRGIKWVGMSKGQNVTLYGTASEIRDQRKVLDPDWVPVRQNVSEPPIHFTSPISNVFCCPNLNDFEPVPWADVLTNIADLHDGLTGGFCYAYGNSCELLTVTNSAAAYLCMPADHELEVDCTLLANMMQDGFWLCNKGQPSGCDQVFSNLHLYTQNYNIVTRNLQ